jgi:lipopolysaccharide transport system permease protein
VSRLELRTSDSATSGLLGLGSVLLGPKRALVGALLVRSLEARYRGSVLGFVWTFLNPLFLASVYVLVFRFYLRIPVENYADFLLSGLLPWMWLSAALGEGAGSILGGSSLVAKSLFPAEILPTVVVLNHMVNFLFGLPVLVIVGWVQGVAPRPLLWLWLPAVVGMQLVFTLGLVLAVAALNVRYRDVQHVVANGLLLWFFVTPILYPLGQVPEPLRGWMRLNPAAILAGMYQGIFVEMHPPGIGEIGAAAAFGLASLALGKRIFDAYRDSFAELV